MKKISILLILFLFLCIDAYSQKVAYAVLEDGTLTFYYGKNKPKGAFDVENLITIQLDYGNYYNKEWYSVREQIKTVVFDKSLKKYRPNNCSYWFDHCNNLTSIRGLAENLYTSEVTDMAYMFSACDHLTTLDVSEFNTNNVTDMACMFWRCEKLTNLDVSSFNTENVASMWMMFEGCENLTSLDLSGFHTDNLINMNGMFRRCGTLTSLDLSGFNTENVTDMRGMFKGCIDLKTIDVGDGWNTSDVTESYEMFGYCRNLIGGQGTKYDHSHTDASYAHIDGGESNPGYFTKKTE